MKKGTKGYVSNKSVLNAHFSKEIRIFVADIGGGFPKCCVYSGDEDCFPDGNYKTRPWKYFIPIPEETCKSSSLTVQQREVNILRRQNRVLNDLLVRVEELEKAALKRMD